MGLFSIIKLASDYAKAKRFVEDKIADKKVDIEKIKNHAEKFCGFSCISFCNSASSIHLQSIISSSFGTIVP